MFCSPPNPAPPPKKNKTFIYTFKSFYRDLTTKGLSCFSARYWIFSFITRRWFDLVEQHLRPSGPVLPDTRPHGGVQPHPLLPGLGGGTRYTPTRKGYFSWSLLYFFWWSNSILQKSASTFVSLSSLHNRVSPAEEYFRYCYWFILVSSIHSFLRYGGGVNFESF